MADYTEDHARAGIETKLPRLDTWPNQFPSYQIVTRYPEYTSVCPTASDEQTKIAGLFTYASNCGTQRLAL
jgi:hypothetical protein